MAEQRAEHSRGTTTTLRVDRPDGTATETVRAGDGRITITRTMSDARRHDETVVRPCPDGAVTVERLGADGVPTTIAPTSVSSAINPYGTTVEQVDYAGIVSIENTFDDDGSLRLVVMRGDWGEQGLELRPDGARSLSWSGPPHHGVAAWNASGELERYEVSFSDKTSYRWDRVGGACRAIVTGWDNRRHVIDDADQPAPDRPRR